MRSALVLPPVTFVMPQSAGTLSRHGRAGVPQPVAHGRKEALRRLSRMRSWVPTVATPDVCSRRGLREEALDGEIAELFDRRANVFASEVLFQLDTFTRWSKASLSRFGRP